LNLDLSNFFNGKKILITGNTGFKGAWLSLYLHHLGAELYGLSLESQFEASVYPTCNIAGITRQFYADINDFDAVHRIIGEVRPDVVFHLAAQAITLEAFQQPLNTFQTNGMGTANVLESLRLHDYPTRIIIVTSDKCYRNNEWIWGYRENDILMGIDPYSASKSVAEIVSNSYFQSFLSKKEHIKMCRCRAGNVIGGGDWNLYRIVPDCMRAWINKEPIVIRNPESIRPWHYILDVLLGYMMAAMHLDNNEINGGAFNFGPRPKSEISVLDLVKTLWKHWGDHSFEPYLVSNERAQYSEHRYLKLNSDKARSMLGWKSLTDITSGLNATSEWYKAYLEHPEDMFDFSMNMVRNYDSKLAVSMNSSDHKL